jgi:NTE family protein
MHASFVVSVDVGYAPEKSIDYSLFGLMGQTVDSMMRANTRRALEAADLKIAVDVEGFGSLDWRRSEELMQRGYDAAEKHRAELLPHALSDADWEAWLKGRNDRRRTTLPVPQYLSIAGIAPSDASVVRYLLTPHVNQPLDLPRVEKDLSTLSGLDRYQSVLWQMDGPPGREGLLVRAREKKYAPPFMMLGLNLENRTSNDFRMQLAGRYLAFDVFGSGSELRIDGAVGSDPYAGFALHRPIFGTRMFVRPYGVAQLRTLDAVQDDKVVAQYQTKESYIGGDVGFSPNKDSEVAGGLRYGRVSATVRAGDPGLPEAAGAESIFRVFYRYDGQDSPIVPSRGSSSVVNFMHYLQSPSAPDFERTNDNVTQLEGGISTFRSWRRVNRLFAMASGGTSFNGHPVSQFQLGYPFRLDAFSVGERNGDHYAVLTVGAARQISRLPDFIGGPVFVGTWFENGSAFDTHENADINSQMAVGLLADTLLGPLVTGASWGFDGGFRFFVGVGRTTRVP